MPEGEVQLQGLKVEVGSWKLSLRTLVLTLSENPRHRKAKPGDSAPGGLEGSEAKRENQDGLGQIDQLPRGWKG